MMSDAANMGNFGSPCQPTGTLSGPPAREFAGPLLPAGREKINLGAQNSPIIIENLLNINLLCEIANAGRQRNFARSQGAGSGIPRETSPRVRIAYPFDN